MKKEMFAKEGIRFFMNKYLSRCFVLCMVLAGMFFTAHQALGKAPQETSKRRPGPSQNVREKTLRGNKNLLEQNARGQHTLAAPKQENLFAVSYEEQPVFYIAAPDAVTGLSARGRAQQASQNLTLAIQAVHATGDGDMLAFDGDDKRITLFVRGYRIIALTPADAFAQGFASLRDYEAHVRTRLAGFVPTEMTRQFWQKRVLRIFLSVVFVLLGIALLRQVSRLFNRAEELVFEKRGSISTVTLLGFPLISGQALGGLLAFATTVGRAVSYLVVFIATVGTVLGQFDSTRFLLPQLAHSMVDPIVRGLQSLVGSIPILVLVGVMLLGLHAALRVLHLLLDAVAEGRYQWKGINVSRIAVLRTVLPVVAIGITTFLVLALLFQRYHTPFEVVVLEMCAAFCLACIPLLARWACGCYLLWRNIIRPGEWVQIGQVQGEVSSVSVGTIQLVPREGGSVDVSPLYAILQPVRYLLGPPNCVVCLTFKRNQPVEKLCQRVLAVVQRVDPQAHVQCYGICDGGIQLQVVVPSTHSRMQHQLYMAVCEASDQGEFDLQMGRPVCVSET
ncbi:MAG: hypothetical protein AAF320_05080 [Myxococcota bacterium]